MEIINSPKAGDFLDASFTMYPSRLDVIEGKCTFPDNNSTFYGYVLYESAYIYTSNVEVNCKEGAFFCISESFEINAKGLIILITRFGYRGLFNLGRIEHVGRLTFIDGCSDTILAPPPRLGDPVLNHLHFPPHINQSVHLHPTIRMGVVARGEGIAFGPSSKFDNWEKPLNEQSIFLLPAQELHAFKTNEKNMDIIVFHPESDWGPTDQAHPMRNRSYLA